MVKVAIKSFDGTCGTARTSIAYLILSLVDAMKTNSLATIKRLGKLKNRPDFFVGDSGNARLAINLGFGFEPGQAVPDVSKHTNYIQRIEANNIN
jgi:hypothetical protein